MLFDPSGFIHYKSLMHITKKYQQATQIAKMTACLNRYGINGFSHDITFAQGKTAIISDRKDILQLYYHQQLPLVCVNDQGRILNEGWYIDQKLRADYHDYQQMYAVIAKKLQIKTMLHIMEITANCQHFYSFTSFLNPVDFCHLVLNHAEVFSQFLHSYKTHAYDLIATAMQPAHLITLPLYPHAEPHEKTPSLKKLVAE